MPISFSEIMVILLVAVVVIKPEQLPHAAKTIGQWVKWFRTGAAKIKREMEEPFQPLTSDKHERH